jgi:hypothetical protein
MKKKGECMECGDENTLLFHDPVDPPHDVEPCLCADCAIDKYRDISADVLNEIAQIRDAVADWKRLSADRARRTALNKARQDLLDVAARDAAGADTLLVFAQRYREAKTKS